MNHPQTNQCNRNGETNTSEPIISLWNTNKENQHTYHTSVYRIRTQRVIIVYIVSCWNFTCDCDNAIVVAGVKTIRTETQKGSEPVRGSKGSNEWVTLTQSDRASCVIVYVVLPIEISRMLLHDRHPRVDSLLLYLLRYSCCSIILVRESLSERAQLSCSCMTLSGDSTRVASLQGKRIKRGRGVLQCGGMARSNGTQINWSWKE